MPDRDMMGGSLLYVTGARFVTEGERSFCVGPFNAATWNRFLKHFESITVVGREAVAARSVVAGRNVASHDRVALDLLPDTSSLRGRLRASSVSKRLRKLMLASDAVVARLPSQFGVTAVHHARRERKPFAVEVAGCAWDGLRGCGSVLGQALAPLMYLRMRKVVGVAPYALYVTAEFLQQRYPPARQANVCSASNVEIEPVPTDVFERRLRRLRAAEDARRVVFGTIGSLNGRVKGLHVAFGALALLRKMHPRISLEYRILGGGDLKSRLKECQKAGVSDIVAFDGSKPSGAPVLSWLDSIDIYLQPSFQEGLPRALVEAMSRACPSIASRIGGTVELLTSSDLHSPGDVGEMARLMSVAIRSSNWRVRAAERNFARAGAYSRPILDARRDAFWAQFATHG